MSATSAADWFSDPAEFRRLCSDAKSEAKGESAETFTHEMMLSANQYGLATRVSGPQMKWLCDLADWVMPQMRTPG
jgi:hypothetical protein